MRGQDNNSVMRRALRIRVCTQCRFRPPGSEVLNSTIARGCEPQCPVFVNLEALARIAADSAGDPLARFEHAIGEGVCLKCTLSESPGDYCGDRLRRDCPLSCYAADVLATLEPLAMRRVRRGES